MGGREDPAEARTDDLRRRLYRPDATPADVDRSLADLPPAEPPGTAPRAIPREPEPTRRRRPLRIAVGAVLALAALTAFLLTRQEAAPAALSSPPVPGAAASRPITSLVLPDTDVRVEDIGEGRTLRVDPAASSGPIAVPAHVDGVAVTGLRWFGAGNAVLLVVAVPRAGRGGRMLVSLTTQSSGVTWTALRLPDPGERSRSPVVLARGGSGRTETDGTTTFLLLPSHAASRVAVEAPAGVGWTLTVAVGIGAATAGAGSPVR